MSYLFNYTRYGDNFFLFFVRFFFFRNSEFVVLIIYFGDLSQQNRLFNQITLTLALPLVDVAKSVEMVLNNLVAY